VSVLIDRCHIQVDGADCDQPHAYVVQFADCGHALCVANGACHGHGACVEHAAEVRTGDYEPIPGPPWAREMDEIAVGRIFSIAAPGSLFDRFEEEEA
jgi:hypothetical protein